MDVEGPVRGTEPPGWEVAPAVLAPRHGREHARQPERPVQRPPTVNEWTNKRKWWRSLKTDLSYGTKMLWINKLQRINFLKIKFILSINQVKKILTQFQYNLL